MKAITAGVFFLGFAILVLAAAVWWSRPRYAGMEIRGWPMLLDVQTGAIEPTEAARRVWAGKGGPSGGPSE